MKGDLDDASAQWRTGVNTASPSGKAAIWWCRTAPPDGSLSGQLSLSPTFEEVLYLFQRSEAAEGLERSQRQRHLRLVVRVLIDSRLGSVQLLRVALSANNGGYRGN